MWSHGDIFNVVQQAQRHTSSVVGKGLGSEEVVTGTAL